MAVYQWRFLSGLQPQLSSETSAKELSVSECKPPTVDRYIVEEVTLGRMAVAHSGAVIRRNPIGIIPKPYQPGKYQLIVDLSALQHSMNDGIPAERCSLDYVSVDQAARLVMKCGKGALMAKTDLQNAYRHVPVHPNDQELLGIEWDGKTYRDCALLFNLQSVPKQFSAVANGQRGRCSVKGLSVASTTWMTVFSGGHERLRSVIWHYKRLFLCVKTWVCQ